MQYAVLYSQAPVWREVERYLFKVLYFGDCVVCKTPTQFIDYSTKNKPSYLCGKACFVKVCRVIYRIIPNQPLTDTDIEKDTKNGTS